MTDIEKAIEVLKRYSTIPNENLSFEEIVLSYNLAIGILEQTNERLCENCLWNNTTDCSMACGDNGHVDSWNEQDDFCSYFRRRRKINYE